jgi:hypothetical protein
LFHIFTPFYYLEIGGLFVVVQSFIDGI